MSIRHIYILLLIASASVNAQTIIPLQIKKIAVNRPVISFTVNGKQAAGIIHSNADLYYQVDKPNALYFGLTDMKYAGKFGISAPGEVDSSYTAKVKNMQFENLTLADKDVSVFSTYPPDDPGYGMLGVKWIAENHVIMDFFNNNVLLQPSESYRDQYINKNTNRFTYLPIFRKNDSFYYCELTINEKKGVFVISTVGDFIIDEHFAKQAKIEYNRTGDTYGGPSGATGYIYKPTQQIFVDTYGKSFYAKDCTIEDIYAYSGEKRPKKESDCIAGYLGLDFLRQHQAIIDFGFQRLFLK